jgi:hypothetical protein
MCTDAGHEVRPRTTPAMAVEVVPLLHAHQLDLLELRLHELHSVVDWHILAVPSGLNASIISSKRFALFLPKILFVTVDDLPSTGAMHLLLDVGLAQGLDMLQSAGMKHSTGDVLLLCLVDEIPRASAVRFLKAYEGYPIFTSFVWRWSFYGFLWQVHWPHSWASQVVVALPMQWAAEHKEKWTATDIRLRRAVAHTPHVKQWLLGLSVEAATSADALAGVVAGRGMYGGWRCEFCYPLAGLPARTQWAADETLRIGGAGDEEAEEVQRIRSRACAVETRAAALRHGVHPFEEEVFEQQEVLRGDSERLSKSGQASRPKVLQDFWFEVVSGSIDDTAEAGAHGRRHHRRQVIARRAFCKGEVVMAAPILLFNASDLSTDESMIRDQRYARQINIPTADNTDSDKLTGGITERNASTNRSSASSSQLYYYTTFDYQVQSTDIPTVQIYPQFPLVFSLLPSLI